MPIGKVKWFNDSKGFGFITSDEVGEVFVHYTSINENRDRKTLNEGQEVQFDVYEGAKGPLAMNVSSVEIN